MNIDSESDNGNIMIIDDEPSNLKVLSKVLVENGYQVRAAKTAADGLSSVYNKLPDLILLDVKLPDMYGHEVCKKLKGDEKTKSIPVIFISVMDNTSDIIKGFEAGGVDYITKPFKIEEVLARVHTHIDMSRTKEFNKRLEKLNLELDEAKKQADKANKAKSDFLANMSHEIRNPMHGIMGFTELLMSMETDSEKFKMLESIYFGSEHLMHLINDILNLAKIDAGKMVFCKRRFDFRRFMENIEMLYSNQATSRGLKFIIEFDGIISNELIGDDTLIFQILNNLIGNSIKFTRTGYIVLTIKEIVSEKRNNRIIEFTILDTGIGINEEKQKKLYEPFEQGEVFIARQFEGTGLGLAIVKKIVDLMNGEIKMETKIGAGTKFTVRLPLESVDDFK